MEAIVNSPHVYFEILQANQLPHAKEVLRALQKKVVDNIVPMDSMLLDCCTLHNHDDFVKLGNTDMTAVFSHVCTFSKVSKRTKVLSVFEKINDHKFFLKFFEGIVFVTLF